MFNFSFSPSYDTLRKLKGYIVYGFSDMNIANFQVFLLFERAVLNLFQHITAFFKAT